MQTSGSAQVHFNNLTNKPTTVSGYGITDAMTTAQAANAITSTNIANWNTAYSWGNHAGLYRPISYVPAWSEITSNPFAFASLANNQLLKYNTTTSKWENWTPNYLTSYTETDPAWTAASTNYYTKTNMQTSGSAQVHFNNLTNKPTTVSGYGITDAMTTAHAANAITSTNIANWNTAYNWGNHAGLYRPISYVPAWSEITSNPFAFASLANNQLLKYNTTTNKWENWTPNYLTSYTETDPAWSAASTNYYTKTNMQTSGSAQVHFNNLTNKPTTVSGYGITDAMTTAQAANAITSTNIANWNTAYSWGNHAGLYRPISYVPAWSEITSNPFAFASLANNQLLKYNTTTNKWENWTPNYLTSYTETDPIYSAWNKSTGIVITSSQVSDFASAVTNNPAMLANTAKNSYPTADATKLAGIAAGAEVNVNADWNATNGDAQILNKPVGTAVGDMLYWNGTTWIRVPVGSNGQTLVLNSSIPVWGGAQNPVLSTSDASIITLTSASCGGTIASDGGSAVTARGVCWNTAVNPTIANSKTTDGSGTGSFTSNLTGLTVGSTYYIRAYATNAQGTAYGNSVSITIQSGIINLTTTAVSNISKFVGSSGGNITSDGGSTVAARGVCYATTANPTISNNVVNSGSGTGSFISNFSGLSPNTLYYVRSFATNSVGTCYGNQVSFTTLADNCTGSFTISHNTAGGVAPVNKTVTYYTVTDIPGEPTKCWITQNLGSDHQATAVNDATEASAGWYWQFNRKQGYKHDGTTRTPLAVWISTINENNDWLTANDPCTLEFGSGWRIPTLTEWTNVDGTYGGNWSTWTGPWNSGLKLHAAGYLSNGDGSLGNRGSNGYYWSSSQHNSDGGWNLGFNSGNSGMDSNSKAAGFSVRCLRD